MILYVPRWRRSDGQWTGLNSTLTYYPACVDINTEWCKNFVLVSRYCSSLVNFMYHGNSPPYSLSVFTSLTALMLKRGPTGLSSNCKTHTLTDSLLMLEILTTQISTQCSQNSTSMWTLRRGGQTCWILVTQTFLHVQSAAPPPPQLLRPHLCYANTSMQTAHQTL